MAINKRLLVKPPSTGITPSEHFGVALYEGDGSSSHSINGGKFGAGAYFKGGTSNNIDLDINLTTKKTISMWVKNNSFPAYNVHLIRPSTDNLNFGFLQSTRTVFLWDGNSTQNWGYAIPNDTNFHHLVLAIDGTNAKLYVDNDDKGSITIVANSQTQLRLGRNSGTSGLDGVMDQVRIFQKQLSSSEVSTLYAETDVESLDPLNVDTTDTLQVLGDSSCIATYRFENNEVDLSGNYDGTGTAIQYAAGRYGQAADFNGSSSNVELPTGSPFNDSDTIKSISAWVKADTTSSRVYPFSIGSTTTDDQFFNFGWIPANNYVLLFIRNGSNSNQAYHSASLTADTNWHHIVVQTTGSAVEIYLDGQSQSVSSTYAGSGSASSWISYPNYTGTVRANIGTNASFGPQYSNGQIDQVRFFNKALSAAEVTTLYNENPLVASYRFEGNANDDTRNYDGTASNVTYEYGLGFTPDLVWFKSRTGVRSHALYDSTRGANKRLVVNGTQAEISNSAFASFDSGGFTVTGSDSSSNNSGEDYVAWCLKANGGTTSSNTDGNITSTVQVNEQAGFSIIQYTSPSSPSSSTDRVGHGLGTTPAMVIVKRTDGVEDWYIWHKELGGGGSGALNKFLRFNTDAQATASNLFNTVNSTVVNLSYTSTGNLQNIAYAFAEVEGFSKFGSYTGNGSTNGPIVETGFEPAFVMIKRTDINGYDWYIWDNKRIPAGERVLYADLTNAENSYGFINFLSNGFQHTRTNAGVNANGGTYIYMAFAADPDTEAPTVAKSFSTVTYTGNGSTQSISGLEFSPSFVWIKGRDSAWNHLLYDSVRGAQKELHSNTTDAEGSDANILQSFDSNGFTIGSSGEGNYNGQDYVAWAFKADDNEPTIFGGPAVAVYKFEDNANDVTGDYNGTATNVTYTSSGKFNKAAVFNGTNAYVHISSLTIPTTATISLWVKANSGHVFSSQTSAFRREHPVMYWDSTNNRFGALSSKADDTSWLYTGTLNGSNWNHIVLVQKSDGTSYLYANGSLQDSVTTTSSTYTPIAGFTLGAKYEPEDGGFKGFFDGEIDQVRIYNGALAQEQVTELYNETASDNDDLNLGAPPKSIISANANSGFSIVQYEGNGVAGTKVPHGLSAAPDFIVVKSLDSTYNWMVYASPEGENKHAYLNLTNVFEDPSLSVWNDTAPTSTVFSISNNANVNLSGENYIAYCFHSVSGYSKIGSYTGNASTNAITGLGFQPDWILARRTNTADNWAIIDSVRETYLLANLTDTEATYNWFEFTSDGFTLSTSTLNASGGTYIYMAFKIN